MEGDGAAGAAGVRHAAPAPAVLVVRAAADHVHVRRQVIQLVPAALRGRADAGDEELEGTEQLAAVATARLSHEVDDAAAGDEVQGVFHEGQGVVREACAHSPTITNPQPMDQSSNIPQETAEGKAGGMCGLCVVWQRGGALTLLLEGLVVRLLQPRLLPHVVAAGLEE